MIGGNAYLFNNILELSGVSGLVATFLHDTYITVINGRVERVRSRTDCEAD